jgi:hypothetical protein
LARKARLASEYLEASLNLYRRTRAEAKRLLGEVRSAGYNQIILGEDSEIAEICRLTCLEMGISIQTEPTVSLVPTLQIEGSKLMLVWPPVDPGPAENLHQVDEANATPANDQRR